MKSFFIAFFGALLAIIVLAVLVGTVERERNKEKESDEERSDTFIHRSTPNILREVSKSGTGMNPP